MILCITVNPSVDHTVYVEGLKVGDTNRVKRTERDAGGKGINVARVFAELGGKAMATGFLGGGPGAYVRRVLDTQGVQHDFLEAPDETRVNFSVESGEGPPTTFNERGPEISAELFERLQQRCREMSADARWLVMGGSLPPGLPDDAFRRLIDACRSEDCSVVLDADGAPMRLGLEAGPTFIKPNENEAERLLGRQITGRDQGLQAARELLELARSKARGGRSPFAVVSLGKDGAALACEDGLFEGISPQVEARSTIGSGDSLIGGMLWALEDGMSVPEALRWGLAAGAATAMTDGTEIARRSMILELLQCSRVLPAG